jgi:hypothetical protein
VLWQFLQRQRCDIALPRTVATIGASAGFVTGFETGCWIGGFIAAFASDSGRLRNGFLLAGIGGMALGCGALGGGFCYLLGSGGSRIFMKAFPSIERKQLPLITDTRLPKIALFLCCASVLGYRRLKVNGLLSNRQWSNRK